jgi:hypothetical protein
MTTITQATIARVTDKATGEVFYTVKSDSAPNSYYTITWNNAGLCWECDCPARTASCKHSRAVVEVIRSKRSQCLDSRYEPITEVSQKGSLHGSRAFSLLK